MTTPHDTETYALVIDGKDLSFELKDTLGEDAISNVDFAKLFYKIFNKLEISEDTKIVYINTIHKTVFQPDARTKQFKFYSFLKKCLGFEIVLVPFEYREDGDNASFFSAGLQPAFITQLFKTYLEGHSIITICHDKRYNTAIEIISQHAPVYHMSLISEEIENSYLITKAYKLIYRLTEDEIRECLK